MAKIHLNWALCGVVYFALAAVASEAADYKINRTLWESVSEEEQGAIISTLRKAGVIEAGDTISGSDRVGIMSVGEVGSLDDFKVTGWQDNACMVACGSTLAATIGLCSTLPPGQWGPCTAAANSIYGVCMEYCTQ